MDKEELYRQAIVQADALISEESDFIARMANTAAILHRTFGFWWTGFYRVLGEEMILGPYQGPVACTRIPYGKGVCGTAWRRGRSIVVPDVDKFPGHIACSAESRSEVVIPLWNRGRITAVLDIDSTESGTFDSIDIRYLEQICTLLSCRINPELISYIKDEIIPRYDSFDMGHRRDHVNDVISQALKLSCRFDVDKDITYTAAAFHDTGICAGRKIHHIASGEIIRTDKALPKWFSSEQIETIAQAAEDHRASSDHEPRSIYGKIIAEADRQLIPDTVIRRAIQYSLVNYPEYTGQEHFRRVLAHMQKKYAEGGYLKLWIPESDNAAALEEIRRLISDEQAFLLSFTKIFSEETEVGNH